MDEGAWQATVHGIAKSQIQLSNFIFTFFHLNSEWHFYFNIVTYIDLSLYDSVFSSHLYNQFLVRSYADILLCYLLEM